MTWRTSGFRTLVAHKIRLVGRERDTACTEGRRATSPEDVGAGGWAPALFSFELEQWTVGLDNPRIAFAPPVKYCTAGTSVSGCQASLSACGTASGTAASVTLTAATVEGQKDGLFFFGDNGRQANPWGNSTSFQCVVPQVVRAPLMTGTGTNGRCDGSFGLDMNTLWTNQPAKNPGVGATVQAQLWYRDPFNTANNSIESCALRLPGAPGDP